MPRRRIRLALIGLLVLVLGGWLVNEATAADVPDHDPGSLPGADSGLPVAPLSTLPTETERAWTLIRRGGPFPYPDHDGTIFDNRERLLPAKPSGYYREYTVATPGSSDRGPRRMVTGDADELYYTGGHDVSFVVVDPRR